MDKRRDKLNKKCSNLKLHNKEIKNLEFSKSEKSIQNCYSTWGKRYYSDYYQSNEAYPPVHTEIIKELLKAENPSSLLDGGCGPASMLRDLSDLGIDLYGFDLTTEMISEAKNIFKKLKLPLNRLWQGSVLNANDFISSPNGKKNFDAAICFGVLPHILKGQEGVVFDNFINVLNSGSIFAIEARNELFSLFSLNRYTKDFFMDKLISENLYTSREFNYEFISKTLNNYFDSNLPPLRKGYENELGYDEVTSRLHNPFELSELAKSKGLVDLEILFYHYHALPPLFENKENKKLYREKSLDIESPRDWRGHFLASAFILKGRKV